MVQQNSRTYTWRVFIFWCTWYLVDHVPGYTRSFLFILLQNEVLEYIRAEFGELGKYWTCYFIILYVFLLKLCKKLRGIFYKCWKKLSFLRWKFRRLSFSQTACDASIDLFSCVRFLLYFMDAKDLLRDLLSFISKAKSSSQFRYRVSCVLTVDWRHWSAVWVTSYRY